MDPKKSFRNFLSELRSLFPDTQFSSYKDTDPAEFETFITPNILKVLQKDASLFQSDFVIFGVNISPLVKYKPDAVWKHIQLCAMYSFLSGDMKEKFSKIAETVKGLWGDSGHSTDEIEKLLGNEESRNKVSEILEFIMSTKLAKIVTNLVESIDISELDINFEDPDDVMNTFKNLQGNPVVEKIARKIKHTIEEKVKNGEFTKETLMRDIESIKVKVQEAFGDMFNEFLGGRKADVPANVLLGNSPEARRARMLARLQRKVQERKTQQ
jgi:hypothetical protein